MENLIIIHDEWDFEVGDFKMQKGRGANHHKGIEDIIRVLGTKDFWRVRVGIGLPPNGEEPSEYVLSKFSDQEIQRLRGLIAEIKINLLNF